MPRPPLAYVEKGSGLPLVLLHGFPLDRRVWTDQLNDLSKDFRVIAPDLPGFGQSRADNPFTLEQQADDVHALLVNLRALPCALAGLSMGGYVALAYWKKYASTLKALIFVDTKASADTSEGKAARDKMIQLVREKGSKAVADQMEPKMLTEHTIKSRPKTHALLRDIMDNCPPRTIEHALAAMRDRPDFDCDLPSIAAPALILVGDSDPIIPVDTAQKMQSAIPHAQLKVIPSASHLVTMEKPTEVNTALRGFLKSVPKYPDV